MPTLCIHTLGTTGQLRRETPPPVSVLQWLAVQGGLEEMDRLQLGLDWGGHWATRTPVVLQFVSIYQG